MTRPKLIAFGAATAALAFSASADFTVAPYARGTLSATNGEDKVVSGAISISPAARSVDKVGSGSTELPVGNIRTTVGTIPLNAHGGTLKLSDSAEPLSPAERPDAILAKACVWLDSTTNVVFGEDGESVSYWHDVRETQDAEGNWSANYWAGVGAFNSGVEGATYPKTRVVDGKRMIYFNGARSGAFMRFANRGSATTANITGVRHVFYVSRHVTGFCFPLGNTGATFFHPSNCDGRMNVPYLSANGDTDPAILGGRFFIDGVACDGGETTIVSNRIHLVQHDATSARSAELALLCGDRTLTGGTYRRSGGDDFGELLVFTQTLTDEECLRLTTYLVEKWEGGVKKPSALAVSASSQAGVAVNVAENESFADGMRLELDGGTLAKTGLGSLMLAQCGTAFGPSPLVMTLEGTLAVDLPEVCVAPKKGDAFMRAATPIEAAPVTRTEGDADAVSFSGGRWRVSSFGGAPRVNAAEAEELVLAGAATNAASSARFSAETIEAEIPNYSFEQAIPSISCDTEDKTATSGGWTIHGRATAKNTVRGWSSWRKLPAPTSWDVNHPYPAPDGERVMELKGNIEAWCTVKVSVAGVYELSFMSSRRYDQTSEPFDIALVSGTTTNWVARHWAYLGVTTNWTATAEDPKGGGFHRSAFRTPWLEKGEHILYLGHPYDIDALPQYDDFHLRLMPEETERTFPVPNGNFEMATYDKRTVNNGNKASYSNLLSDEGFSLNSTLDGWTLTQTSNATNRPAASPVSRWTPGYFREAGTLGDGQLVLVWQGAAATSPTFTLPAGTWRLRCKMGAWRTMNSWVWAWNDNVWMGNTPTVEATVSTNGAPAVSLGTFTRGYHSLVTANFAKTLTLAEDTPVSVTLKQNVKQTGAVIDDLEFVAVDSPDLITNGSFENGDTGWSRGSLYLKDDTYWGKCGAARQTLPATFFGVKPPPSGSVVASLIQCGWFTQTVNFPKAGLYELTFWSGTRVDMNALTYKTDVRAYGGNSIDVMLVKDNVSNLIYRTGSCLSTNFLKRICHFRVAEKGPQTLVFRSRNGDKRADGTYISTLPTNVGFTFAKNDSYVYFDDVSLKAIDALPEAPAIPPETKLNLGKTTRLALDYDGVVPVAELRIGGRKVHGTIDASHKSGLVTGPGALQIPEIGLQIIVR